MKEVEMKTTPPKDIDEYIAGFPKEVREILEEIRRTIRRAVPEAEEAISYQIPTFRLNGSNLIHFAAYKKHIGLYPAPRGHEDFEEELAGYAGGKGTVQFPLDRLIPYDLIRRIVEYRVEKSLAGARQRARSGSSS
jgi:uncharacterized protein YdhG (YjbR/CyaY superfamily)